MDGWESRRRRTPGHDWCVVALGMRGASAASTSTRATSPATTRRIARIDAIDTPATPSPSVCAADGAPWAHAAAQVAAAGQRRQLPRRSTDGRPWTHVRLNIFPDGGVARLRVYGEVAVDWTRVAAPAPRRRSRRDHERRAGPRRERHALRRQGQHDHAGPRDEHGRWLGDAATARARATTGRSCAWARPRSVSKIEIDTNHFKGNYPESASLEGCLVPAPSLHALGSADLDARSCRSTQLKPHHRHFFSRELATAGPVSHVRLNIFPDGGISRLRVHGTRGRRLIGPRPTRRGGCCARPAARRGGSSGCSRGGRSAAASRCSRPRARVGRPRPKTTGARRSRITRRSATARRCASGFRRRTHLSTREQAGVDGAPDDVLDALAEGNRRYEEHVRLHLHRLRDRAAAPKRCWRC